MIQAILVFNNHGKPRLVRFYQRFPEEIQQQIVRETFHLVLKRDDNICNFLEGGSTQVSGGYLSCSRRDPILFWKLLNGCASDITHLDVWFLGGMAEEKVSLIGGPDYKLIYRHYATLYFVFCVDSSESELGILDLIQVCVVS
ncbi:hypothetical protein GH733_014912 [Mirounga leonina]|nr:hypothetical protein GH733_014912 [Mirounga leonina]